MKLSQSCSKHLMILFSFILTVHCGSQQSSEQGNLKFGASAQQFGPTYTTTNSKLYTQMFDRLETWGLPLTSAGQTADVDHPFYYGTYDCETKSSAWVQHILDKNYIVPKPNTEGKNFTFNKDSKLPTLCQASSQDYTSSGYDRGHLAPARDFAGHGPKAVEQSFLMSNISPQVGIGFNRHLWALLERSVRDWAEVRGQVIVLSGPIYDAKKSETFGKNAVVVPDSFYKIVVDISDLDSPEALAFVMKNIDHRYVDYPNSKVNPKCQDDTSKKPAKLCERDNLLNIERHQVSIDSIEKLTGLDFFPDMPASTQSSLEESEKILWDYSQYFAYGSESSSFD